MLAKILSAATAGIDAYTVEVEADVQQMLPLFVTVGLPDAAVKESKERVQSAIKNSDFMFPAKKITINLAPADIKKEGSGFDLPIAVGILAATGQILRDDYSDFVMVGELALDGRIRPIHGVLSMAIHAATTKATKMIVPVENAKEAAMSQSIDVYPVESLTDTISFLEGSLSIEPFKIDIESLFEESRVYDLDFCDVRGQESAKRALEVSAAGGHNIIMVGPPGSGKTMLARRMPTILPNMTLKEALETTKVHSVAGKLPKDCALIATRPFRDPHHTISNAGLIGGGTFPKPGEVSLAHYGVLFLDEIAEFRREVLEVMRQPLEDGKVTISRAATSLTYPANFMLAAAMNPCPCGYHGDNSHECNCMPNQIQRYMSKLSGPLMDRIDIHVEVPTVNFKELSSETTGEKSEPIRKRVNVARQRQLKRFEKYEGRYCNAHMESHMIREICTIDEKGKSLLKMAITQQGLSARAYDRILKVSRTIADLEGSDVIDTPHIAEAIGYRSLDRNLWM
ncbi:MAG: YifB family Mg chelatase-like AAA ATPase [candidate division Zixibacteria bacterium]|nr:YifB family Mg chelatase-like AAA ATPase [candidate division Zixibacteria bacterium]